MSYAKRDISNNVDLGMGRRIRISRMPNCAYVEFTNNYHHRLSAEWVPQETAGVASSCCNYGQFVVYHKNIGLVPHYGGHVPGESYTIGKTYGEATVDAKRYLACHKM